MVQSEPALPSSYAEARPAMPPPRMTTRERARPVRLKSEWVGARKGGAAAAAAAVGASPSAPIVANIAPAPPLTPTARRKLRRLTEDSTSLLIRLPPMMKGKASASAPQDGTPDRTQASREIDSVRAGLPVRACH